MNNSRAESNHTNELEPSFKKDVTAYIQRCHLKDGGYFFARVLPSGGLDTWFAIKNFAILGVKPERPAATARFFTDDIKPGRLENLTGIYLAVEVLNDLGRLTDGVRNWALPRVLSLQNKAGGFGANENIAVEVTSELQETYQAVKTLSILGVEPDKQKVRDFVSRFKNPDGGYGAQGFSTLVTTFYATEILKLLGVEAGKLNVTRDFLRKREANWRVTFIDDLYWLVGGLANLGEKTDYPEKVLGFVLACQCKNGGFSRFTEMGIPTLEYTYYALSVLENIRALEKNT